METKPSKLSAANRAWAEGRRVCFELGDQRIISFPADRYPILARASAEELSAVQLRVQGQALRWEALDEDILVEDVLRGRFPRPRNPAPSTAK